MNRLDLEWEKWGQRDPYFGVLSSERFRSDRLDPKARSEFFDSGEQHVAAWLEIVRSHVRASFAPRRALDFGCGVGRVTVPLARHCSEVVGIDISPAMLAEARRNCDVAAAANVTLVLADDDLSRVPGRFDFVHSFIVFQHIPSRRGERLLGLLLDRLENGGIAAVHFTVARQGGRARRWIHRLRRSVPWIHGLVNVARHRPWGDPLMMMDYYQPDRLLSILNQHGCRIAHQLPTDHDGQIGVVLFAEKSARAS